MRWICTVFILIKQRQMYGYKQIMDQCVILSLFTAMERFLHTSPRSLKPYLAVIGSLFLD